MEYDSNSPNTAINLAATPTRRYDGWTAERQEQFLLALASCGCVREACAAVGMSHVSAYKLRARPSAIAFRRAWDAALDNAMHRLEEAALSRAIHGVARPIFYHGEQVGEWREYDERLAMFLLRYRRRHRFTEPFAQPEALRPPGMEGTEPNDDEAMGRLEWYLDELTDDAAPPSLTAFPSRAGESGNFGNFDPDCEADCDAVAPPVEPRP